MMRTLFGLLVGLAAGLAVAVVILEAGPTTDGTDAVGESTSPVPERDVDQPGLPRLTSDTAPPAPPEPMGLE